MRDGGGEDGDDDAADHGHDQTFRHSSPVATCLQLQRLKQPRASGENFESGIPFWLEP